MDKKNKQIDQVAAYNQFIRMEKTKTNGDRGRRRELSKQKERQKIDISR